MGGLEQELSGINDVFRRTIEACFCDMAERFARCPGAARHDGDIPADSDPRQMANVVIDCWEGASLRSRLRWEAEPLDSMLDYYLRSAVAR